MVSTGAYFRAVHCCPRFSVVPSVRCCNRASNYATARFLQDPRPLKMKAVCSFELLGVGNPAVECKLPSSELCVKVNFIVALSSALFVVIMSFLIGIVTVVDIEICALLGYYTVFSGNSLPLFWDNLSVPFSRVFFYFFISWPLKMGQIGSPEMLVRITTLCCLIFQKSTDLIYFWWKPEITCSCFW